MDTACILGYHSVRRPVRIVLLHPTRSVSIWRRQMRIWKPSVRNCPILLQFPGRKSSIRSTLAVGLQHLLELISWTDFSPIWKNSFPMSIFWSLPWRQAVRTVLRGRSLKCSKGTGLGGFPSTRRRCSKRHWIWLEDGIQ